ncbi:protein ETHYLENE-INSENSITIVE 2 [Lolium perenne]|nr:protein ETHYLENE-INSENSITIVE 2 [Lolium perenne]
MDGVRSLAHSLGAGEGGGRNNLFRTLGPALFISIGYIDLGKWVTTIDAGSRFGYDLVLLVLLFNFSAVLCQYLSICIGMVTTKNLAEICVQEYSQPICAGLGVQAIISLLTAEVTMISGIAMGFNLVFEYDDIVTGIWFASFAVNLLPYAISHLDKKVAGTLNTCIAGLALVCFVLGLLVSQPKVPLDMDVMFPKLSGESAYSLMALLGGNVIAHNFYVHSSFVQAQKRSPVTLGSLFHDHLISILFIFSGVFLVNYVLISSAAVGSSDALLLTFQDVVELMNQIFMNPAAPVVFLVVLLLSSHIISLSSIVGSHAIVENFFGVNLSLSAHHLLLKVFAMIPTIYYARIAGSEAIYQLLIICPVIQAMLLPSSVIPVFRVASSRSLMGSYRISSSVEILAFLSFLLMLFTNIIFMAEILFGDSTWTNNMKGNTGSPVVLPYTLIVLTSCVSIVFTLFLAVTPLKSASNEAETLELSVHSQREPLGSAHHREELFLEDVAQEEIQRSSTDALREQSESHQESALEHTESSDTTAESDHDSQQSTAYTVSTPKAQPSPPVYHEEPKPVCVADWTESIPKVSTPTAVEHINAENIKVKSTTEKDVEVVAEVCTDKDNITPRNLEYEKSAVGRAPFNPDGPPSLTFSRGKDTDAGNGSGSLSTLSGLGRAARRQLAATLDEFWGHLFDYHGKLTQDANDKRYNFLLGLDSKTASSAVRADNQSIEASKSPLMRDVMRGSPTSLNSWDSMSREKEIRGLDWNSGQQMGSMGSSNWSQSMNLPYTDISSPSSSLLEQNANYYSNFSNVPSYTDNQFYQPATIHGYQLASYLKGMNASRSQYSNIPLDPRRVPRSSEYSFPNYPDSPLHARSQNVRGSLGANPLQNPTMNRLNTSVERPYYDSFSVEESESGGSSAYSKKYHSSPDISALIAASRKALLNEANLGGAAGNQSYLSKLASERPQYVDPTARSNAQAAFNERSQHNLQRDVLSMQLGMNPNAKSLWAQQPFEQLFGVSSAELNKSEVNTGQRSSGITNDDSSYTECEVELLQSLRSCIVKILKVEGSGWLFRQNGGCDENLIDQVAAAEKYSQETTENLLSPELRRMPSDKSSQPLRRNDDRAANCMHGLPNCGESCVWQSSLVVSFGVWCIRRVLDLSLVESRPELWGKYTYVLNRLQGVLEPAFSKPRKPLTGCTCLQIVGPVARPISGTFTTSAVILETIKDVEQAISGRKGRSGTAAGDVAFPKGKENLASVLKRYKRRLSSKPSAGQ